MHGWAFDARFWLPWIRATEETGWRWSCGERGYGQLEPKEPAWDSPEVADARRVVICHSLGLHLLAPSVLERATDVVLLASFGRFLPLGRRGQRLRAALDRMLALLDNEANARGMITTFLANAASPLSLQLLPMDPQEMKFKLCCLRSDLELLRGCEGLPSGFPHTARVLIVEPGLDKIVDPEARRALVEELPAAEAISFSEAGHALLRENVVARVAEWLTRG